MFYYRDIILDERDLSSLNLKSASKKGDSKAQFELGNCYYYGQGIRQNYNKAFGWYSKSANNGYAEGQYYLGICYENGFGTSKDYNKAFEWYSKSAKYGCAEGQFKLGFFYRALLKITAGDCHR